MSEPTQDNKALAFELGVPVVLIGIAAAFLLDSRNIAGATFDALGPAPIPRLIGWCVIALCTVVLGQTLLARKNGTAPTSEPDDAEELPVPQPLLALAMLGLTAGYVLAMAYRVSSFAIVTIVYLVLCVGVLCRFSKQGMIVAAVIAAVMGFGCQYLFTEVFVIDLPTGGE